MLLKITKVGSLTILMRTSLRFMIKALAAGVLYSSLIIALLGKNENPIHLGDDWELAAEHGELIVEHFVHALAISIAAIPLVVAFALIGFRPPTSAIMVAAFSSAIPYAVGPLGACLAVEGAPLCHYSWQLESLKVALLPLAFGASARWAIHSISRSRANRKRACE